MELNLKARVFFRFEEDFIEPEIRCIPMAVRFKLDACGIKLKLAEWSRMQPGERAWLAAAPCASCGEADAYRQKLAQLILERTGGTPTVIPVPENPAWSRADEIPYTLEEKLQESGDTLTLAQWRNLTDLQRFALLKLSYPGHESKNFPRALHEFGLKQTAP